MNFYAVKIFQKLFQHTLSRFAGICANIRVPWFKNFLIQKFANYYAVDLSECEIADLKKFLSFNEFFLLTNSFKLKFLERILTMYFPKKPVPPVTNIVLNFLCFISSFNVTICYFNSILKKIKSNSEKSQTNKEFDKIIEKEEKCMDVTRL